jgi:AcrR family transcriptional regulator
MRAMQIPENGPKRRLLDAAEELFAAEGFEKVSIRDIAKACEANVAAVNYHFGSREGLVNLVLSRYLAPINQERMTRLEAAERKWAGKVVPIEEILDAFARPLVGQVRKSDLSERLFCKLLGRIFSEQQASSTLVVEDMMRPVVERFLRAFRKALPGLEPEELLWRVHMTAGAMIHLLSHAESLQRLTQGAAGHPGIEQMLARFVRFAAAGLREGLADGGEAPRGPQATFDF